MAYQMLFFTVVFAWNYLSSFDGNNYEKKYEKWIVGMVTCWPPCPFHQLGGILLTTFTARIDNSIWSMVHGSVEEFKNTSGQIQTLYFCLSQWKESFHGEILLSDRKNFFDFFHVTPNQLIRTLTEYSHTPPVLSRQVVALALHGIRTIKKGLQ